MHFWVWFSIIVTNFAIVNQPQKIMKKFNLLLTLIVVGLSSSTMSEAAENSGGKVPYETIILQPKRPVKRPNAPSLIRIECSYYDGILSLTSDYYEGGFSLSFENYETGATYTVPSIQIGETVSLVLEIGEYELTAVSEDGTELIGFMQIY